MTHDCLKCLKSATSHIVVPAGLKGLHEAADKAQNLAKFFPSAFWNVPPRSSDFSDAEYVGLVISILKKRVGKRGIDCALSLIAFLEEKNAVQISNACDECLDEDAK